MPMGCGARREGCGWESVRPKGGAIHVICWGFCWVQQVQRNPQSAAIPDSGVATDSNSPLAMLKRGASAIPGSNP